MLIYTESSEFKKLQ